MKRCQNRQSSTENRGLDMVEMIEGEDLLLAYFVSLVVSLSGLAGSFPENAYWNWRLG